MLTWLTANLANILIVLALVALVAVIIATMIRDKKKGRSACGAGCAHCAMRGSCHNKSD